MATSLGDLAQYRRLLQMILVLGVGGSFQVGFQLSMITYTSVHVKAFINETWLERSGRPVPPETLTLLWSSIVSVYGLGGLLGSMASGYLAGKYGKKKCLLGNNLVMLAGAGLLGSSKAAKSFEAILAGRFLSGVSAGLSVPLHPQYLGEVSPKKLRGFANSTMSLFWSLGKALGQVMGQRELLGSALLWPALMALTGLASSVQLLTLPFFPESPPHLFLHRGDEEACLRAMETLWGKGPHQAELEDLRAERAALQSARSKGVWAVVRDPALRWQLYLLVLTVVTMQLSGINAIYFYTFEVLHAAGFEEDHIPYLTLGVSLCELLSAVLCSFIIEHFRRKTILWGGYGLMASVLAAVTLTLSLQPAELLLSRPFPSSAGPPGCPTAASLCSSASCSASEWAQLRPPARKGPGLWGPRDALVPGGGSSSPNPPSRAPPAAGAIVSVRVEIFDQSSRSSAFVIGSALNWVGVFAIGMVFPFIVEHLQQFSFLIFMGALYTSSLLIYLFLPETKNKSIVEIREEFDKLNFKGKPALALGRGVTAGGPSCTKL
ncbi:hypothetical protein lerEdw1_019486 [Lerista edwardsae]|nr:hypothetical protein lerEdw1_019486 [Lerista edwardsae]